MQHSASEAEPPAAESDRPGPDLALLTGPWGDSLGAALDILEGKKAGSLDEARAAYTDFFATRFPAPPGVA